MSSEPVPFVEQIAKERLERELPDAKPLLTPGEARAPSSTGTSCERKAPVTALR